MVRWGVRWISEIEKTYIYHVVNRLLDREYGILVY